jgi:hypothetical protein
VKEERELKNDEIVVLDEEVLEKVAGAGGNSAGTDIIPAKAP